MVDFSFSRPFFSFSKEKKGRKNNASHFVIHPLLLPEEPQLHHLPAKGAVVVVVVQDQEVDLLLGVAAAGLGALFGANFGGPRDARHPQDPRGLDIWNPAFQDPGKGPHEGPAREEKGFFDELPGTQEGVIYLFDRLEDLCHVSSHIPEKLNLINALYVDEGKGTYYLVVHFRRMDQEIRYVISLLSQYCSEWFFGHHAELIVKEHTRTAIKSRALQKLGKIERSEI